jgi:hypothetical protein
MKYKHYTDEDFDKMLIPVHRLKEKDNVLQKFTILKEYKEFQQPLEDMDINNIMVFIVLCYDQNSPLVLNIVDPYKRRVEAAKLAGFRSGDDGTFFVNYMSVVLGEEFTVNKMIIRYCRMQRNTEFAKLMIFEESYYKELEALKNETDAGEKNKIRNNINNFSEDMMKASEKLLLRDVTKELIRDLMEDIDEEQLAISPEMMAKKEGDDIHPYGKEYKPVKLKLDHNYAGYVKKL